MVLQTGVLKRPHKYWAALGEPFVDGNVLYHTYQRDVGKCFGGRIGGMKITYGLAEFDNYTGRVDWNINLPMDGVQCGTMYEFLRSAGEHGWELCGGFPSGLKGMKRAIPDKAEGREYGEAAEVVALIFKKV